MKRIKVFSINKNTGQYCLVSTSREIYIPETTFCELNIDDFDMLYKYQDNLNELDIYIYMNDATIKIRDIGETTLNKL